MVERHNKKNWLNEKTCHNRRRQNQFPTPNFHYKFPISNNKCHPVWFWLINVRNFNEGILGAFKIVTFAFREKSNEKVCFFGVASVVCAACTLFLFADPDG
jgi:hypothetical protein